MWTSVSKRKSRRNKAAPPRSTRERLTDASRDHVVYAAAVKEQYGSCWARASEARSSPASRVVCLGLGSPGESDKARAQLVLLSALVAGSTSVLEVYDPVLSEDDSELIAEHLASLQVKTNARVPTKDELRASHDEPVFFYMPHCPRSLYELVLELNASCPASAMLILGNRLDMYTDPTHAAYGQESATKYPHISQAVTRFEIEPLVEPGKDERQDIFNDLAFHHVRKSTIAAAAPKEEDGVVELEVDEVAIALASAKLDVP